MAPPPSPQLPLSSGFKGYLLAACLVVVVSGYCQIFAKAHRKHWEAVVPGYNGVVLAKIVGRPLWWGAALWSGPLSMLAVPCIRAAAGGMGRGWWLLALPGVLLTLFFHWKTSMDLAKSFGLERRFGWRLAFLPMVFVPWIGWGYAEYKSPAGKAESRSGRRARLKAEEEAARAAYDAKQAARAVSTPVPAAKAQPAPVPAAPATPTDPFVV